MLSGAMLRYALAVLLAQVSAVPVALKTPVCDNVSDPDKKDCAPSGSSSNSSCTAAGCCWQPLANGSSTPWCYFPVTPGPPAPPGPPPPPGPPGPSAMPFTDADKSTMYKFFLANINIDGQGGVVASPDPHTPGGSYYFHWARDGALTMHTLTETAPSSVDLKTLFENYIGWVQRTHAASDSLVDSRIEAKFILPGGAPFQGPWCRPQTDGPGLRAIALIGYGNALLEKGQMEYARSLLWSADNTYSVIKYDLDWIAGGGYLNNSCDLWEEVRSDDFFWNKFTMRRALTLGADFAKKMNDPASANKYAAVAQQLLPAVQGHYANGFIFEAQGREKDGAVICALNDGYNDDGVFSASSREVADTISTYNDAFHAEYPINSVDDAANIPGILYGRYPGDTYGGGNPWVLTSACLAQLFYRAASELHNVESLDPRVEEAWRAALPPSASAVANDRFSSGRALANVLAGQGDGILARLRYHTVGGGLHQPEQLDKHNGFETSATDLTWSYATIFKAMTAKEMYDSL